MLWLSHDNFCNCTATLANKNLIYNNPTAQGLDSYFIANTKENSKVKNSTITNENVNWNSNVSSDINEQLK